jgi:hypothetical protein
VADLNYSRSYVLYGRSGSGKTTLASTFPKPILFLDVKDRGLDSVADAKDTKMLPVESFADFEDIYWMIKNDEFDDEYKTIVIDTVSQLQSIVVHEYQPKKDKKRDTTPGDWGSLTRREWGDIAALMKEWLINYRDLEKNIVFIAQDRAFNFEEDDDGTEGLLLPEVGPALSPSIAKTLNASVSMIGNTFIRRVKTTKEVRGKKVSRHNTEYCLRIGPSPIYTTKIRKPKEIIVPEVLVDPTYEDIEDIIEGVE